MQYGIWGATTPRERKRIRRAQGRPSIVRSLVVVRPIWQREALDDPFDDDEVSDLLTYS